ncbi:MAG: DUF4411 family protein [Candidatus Cloacimonetes bacterium]|nr:DUF4411 family protein [Candidatus Cloacimonadota bacterium]
MYVIDSNIFIAAHRSYYAMDIAPGFWQQLLRFAAAGRLCSIEQVYHEIMRGYDPKKPGAADALAIWASTSFKGYFHKTDGQDISEAYAKIIDWVSTTKHYPRAAIDEFASVCDSWLCAYALANNCVLVTNENKIAKTSKVSIPDLCLKFGIEYINVFEFMRELGIKLN